MKIYIKSKNGTTVFYGTPIKETKEESVIRDRYILDGLRQAALIVNDMKWLSEIDDELNKL